VQRESSPSVPPPAFEQKTVHILVRWLILALAFHFLALSGVRPDEFPIAIQITSILMLSNLLLMFIPARLTSVQGFFHGVVALDLAYVAAALYFLREPFTVYHWVYIVALGLLFWRGNLRETLLVLAGGLVVCGAATAAIRGEWEISADGAAFLRTTILLAVAVFYFFLMGLLDRNARLFHTVARAKQEWERTADAMSELILMVDESGRIRRVNRALAARLGKNPAELVGRPWHSALDGRDLPLPDSPLDRMFQTLAVAEGRFTHARVAGEAHAAAIPLFEDDALVGAIYVLRPTQKTQASG
jgi:PAS domain-containing protein